MLVTAWTGHPCHGRGRRFKSSTAHHKKALVTGPLFMSGPCCPGRACASALGRHAPTLIVQPDPGGWNTRGSRPLRPPNSPLCRPRRKAEHTIGSRAMRVPRRGRRALMVAASRSRPRVAQIVPLVVTLLGLSSPWPAAATGGPKVATHPRTGPPGRVVRVTGQGFGSREVVDLSFGRHALATTSTDASGSFRRKVQIPRRAHPGNHWISATGAASGGTATTPFLVDTDWPQFRGDS